MISIEWECRCGSYAIGHAEGTWLLRRLVELVAFSIEAAWNGHTGWACSWPEDGM